MSHFLPSDDYSPHDVPIPPLEKIVSVADETATCHVTVSASSVLAPSLDPDGNLPGWSALELMAQTIGVWPGRHRQQQGQVSITLSVVLSARGLIRATGALSAGKRLNTHVKLLTQDVQFDSFEYAIQADNETLAAGRVNTFQSTSEEINMPSQQGAST